MPNYAESGRVVQGLHDGSRGHTTLAGSAEAGLGLKARRFIIGHARANSVPVKHLFSWETALLGKCNGHRGVGRRRQAWQMLEAHMQQLHTLPHGALAEVADVRIAFVSGET